MEKTITIAERNFKARKLTFSTNSILKVQTGFDFIQPKKDFNPDPEKMPLAMSIMLIPTEPKEGENLETWFYENAGMQDMTDAIYFFTGRSKPNLPDTSETVKNETENNEKK